MTLKFFSVDLAGNEENYKTEIYVIDATYPVTDITSHPVVNTNNISATFVFSANKVGSTFQCKLDDGAYALCSSPKDYNSLTEGSHTFTVKATDTLDHEEPSPPSFTWAVDLTSPSLVGAPTFGTVTDDSIVINKPTLVTEEGSGLYEWQVKKDSITELGFNPINTTSIIDLSLSENTQYTYDAQFSDNASNLGDYGMQASKYTLVDTPANFSASSGSKNITLSVDIFANDTSGLSGYYFSRSGANSGWVQTNSWIDSGLSCGHSYEYSVKYRNGDGIETDSISIEKSTSRCGGSSGSSGSISTVRVLTNPVPDLPITIPTTVCNPGEIFSPITGLLCTSYQILTRTTESPASIEQVPLCSITATLKQGSKGPEVKCLQTILHITSDGLFGPKTKVAVISFQKLNNLTADGIVGPLTKAHLFK